MRRLCILGATGSIGESTLKIVDIHPQDFEVFALSAHTNVSKMLALCLKYSPKMVVMTDVAASKALMNALSEHNRWDIEVLGGDESLSIISAHRDVDFVMAAIVGSAGLPSVLAAIKAAKTIALANKESLVVSGSLFMQSVKTYGATILPVDSEHNAIFQCLEKDFITGNRPQFVESITLTASGGPFLGKQPSDLVGVTAKQAISHPRWSMGPKISTDSATMMNKGFEVIETHWLFNMPVDNIKVVIHPQSIIHSFVHFLDGSTLAQLGQPDMCVPISYCMGYPERIDCGIKTLDILKYGRLDFIEPDVNLFKALPLAYEALRVGQAKTCILNAANEVAVASFLQGQIAFLDIVQVLESTLSAIDGDESSLSAIIETETKAKSYAKSLVEKLS